MLKPILIGALLLILPAPVFAQACLHGSNETAGERMRREQAIVFARQLNAAEQAAAGLAARQGYRPLNELPNVPRIPTGFALKLQTDGTGYTFSLKDTRDPCGFAVFSDQDGDVYAATPEPRGPTVVPLGTR
jgi:hypothetical protein